MTVDIHSRSAAPLTMLLPPISKGIWRLRRSNGIKGLLDLALSKAKLRSIQAEKLEVELL